MGSGITVPGSGITSHWDRDQQFLFFFSFFFLRDQGAGYSICVGLGTKIYHTFRIEDQESGHKNGISEEKT